MSDMLEQAIIDAEALRGAALKNAQTLVLEKYSDQIKESIETLLEQDDPGLNLDAELGLDPSADQGIDPMSLEDEAPSDPMTVSSVMEHIPFAATASDDEQIEIPLDRLLEEIGAIKDSFLLSELEDLEEESLDEAEELEESLEEELDEELEEDIDISEDLLEALTVDIQPKKRGWAGMTEGEIELAEEELLALEQDSKVREEKAALRAAVKELTELKESKEQETQELYETLE